MGLNGFIVRVGEATTAMGVPSRVCCCLDGLEDGQRGLGISTGDKSTARAALLLESLAGRCDATTVSAAQYPLGQVPYPE